MNEFRVLNDKGDIEVKILKPANAVFQTDEFRIDSTITVYKNAFNIFDLVFENQQLKDNWNKLKEYLKGFDIEYLNEVMEHNLANTLENILNKIQELEQGSDRDE